MHDVVIIGCGQIAGGYDSDRPADAPPLTHAAAFQCSGAFRLLACVDPDARRREAFARRWEVLHALPDMTSLADIVSRPAVVSICSPTAFHAEHLEAALDLRPRLVFCEKPLTASTAASAELVARYADAGVLLAVNYNRRWAPDMQSLAARLASGELGALRSVIGLYNKGLFNNGSHMIDLLHMLVGPLELMVADDPLFDHFSDDPTVAALLRSRSGVPVHLVAAHAADYAVFELTLITETGIISIEDGGRIWRERGIESSPHHAGYKVLREGRISEGGYAAATMTAIANIRAALDEGAALASDGSTALAAQQFCAAIRAASGHSVSIEDVSTHVA